MNIQIYVYVLEKAVLKKVTHVDTAQTVIKLLYCLLIFETYLQFLFAFVYYFLEWTKMVALLTQRTYE